MATIDIKDGKGKKAGTAELPDSVFGIEPNVPVMHLAVRAQRASWRQGTHNTLTRGKVSGGGKKPWRQKGTGRARQGTIRAPPMGRRWRGVRPAPAFLRHQGEPQGGPSWPCARRFPPSWPTASSTW